MCYRSKIVMTQSVTFPDADYYITQEGLLSHWYLQVHVIIIVFFFFCDVTTR